MGAKGDRVAGLDLERDKLSPSFLKACEYCRKLQEELDLRPENETHEAVRIMYGRVVAVFSEAVGDPSVDERLVSLSGKSKEEKLKILGIEDGLSRVFLNLDETTLHSTHVFIQWFRENTTRAQRKKLRGNEGLRVFIEEYVIPWFSDPNNLASDDICSSKSSIDGIKKLANNYERRNRPVQQP